MYQEEVEIALTEPELRALDQLVEEGIYMDRQDAMRDSLRHLFEEHGIEPFTGELPPYK